MLNINKNNCCLFKNNPNIDPITKNPLDNNQKKQWIDGCTKYLIDIEDEKVESLKNVDIYAPRQSEILSLTTKLPQRAPSPVLKSKKPQKPPLPGQRILPIVVSPSLPVSSQVGISEIIYPSTEILPSVSENLDNYYISINSDFIFNDDILTKLRVADLKYLLKNGFTNVNATDIIKEYNKKFNNKDTYTKITQSKDNIIQFIKFLKNEKYTNIIVKNLNDEIYNIFITNKLNINENINKLFTNLRKKISTPSKLERIVSYESLREESLYDKFTDENIKNNYDLLLYRAKYVNSDNFLNELNIELINNEIYLTKYNDKNYIFVLKLFFKDDSPNIPKLETMPDFVYNLLYVNKDKSYYKKVTNDLLEKNNKVVDNNFFKAVLKIFLNYIKTKPFNKYIPPNLNKYILSQSVVEKLPEKQKRATSTELIRPKISEKPSTSRSASARQARPFLPQQEAQPPVRKLPSAREFFYGRKQQIKPPYVTYKETAPPEIEEIYKPISPPTLYPTEPVLSSPPYRPVSPPAEYYEMKRKEEEEERRRIEQLSPVYQPTEIYTEEIIKPSIYEKPPMSESIKKVYKIKEKQKETYDDNKKLNYQDLKKKWKDLIISEISKNPSAFEKFAKKEKITGKTLSKLTKIEYLDFLIFLKLIQ